MYRNIRNGVLIAMIGCFTTLLSNQPRGESGLVKDKANRLHLKLVPGKTASPELIVKIPEDFVLVSSFSMDGEEMYEYLPKGGNIDSWSELLTVMHFKMPMNDLKDYLRRVEGQFKNQGSDYHFAAVRIENGIPCCVYRNMSTAVQINPGEEPKIIADQDELAMNLVAQGDHCLCGVTYTIRISKTATVEERDMLMRKILKNLSGCSVQK